MMVEIEYKVDILKEDQMVDGPITLIKFAYYFLSCTYASIDTLSSCMGEITLSELTD